MDTTNLIFDHHQVAPMNRRERRAAKSKLRRMQRKPSVGRLVDYLASRKLEYPLSDRCQCWDCGTTSGDAYYDEDQGLPIALCVTCVVKSVQF